jgi:iron(III) transport system permease protein
VAYAAGLAIGLVGLLPILFVAEATLSVGWTQISSFLLRDRIGQLLTNTAALVVTCLTGCVVLGLAAAWLVERTDLPGRRIWAAVLVAPLAVPAFVNSYAWSSHWPRFEGLAAATVITVLSYYPFVYLPVASALRGLNGSLEECALTLGRNRIRCFFDVVIPQLRVPLLGGALLVGLHILAEFGALQMIGYETFTTAILVQYQSTFNGTAATMLSGVLLLCCLLLLSGEVAARGRARYSPIGPGASRPAAPAGLGLGRWPAVAAVALLLVFAVGVPVVGIARWWSHGSGLGPELGAALLNTLRLSALGALATVIAALPIAWLAVRRRGPLSTAIERCAYLTSSLPGVVVALALVTASVRMLPAAYQTSALVVAGYVILFLPRALVCLRSVVGQIGPELDEVARTLGASAAKRFARLTFPLLAPGLTAGIAFVFLAASTELTATLLLAPTGTVTLATQFWSHSDSLDYPAAAPYAATMIVLAAPLTYLLLHQSRVVRGR